MKVEFDLKYGKNIIEIPITDNTKQAFNKSTLVNLHNSKVTIYNDICETGRKFERFVISKCQIYGQLAEKTNDTIINAVNVKTVVTRDVERYKPPAEYISLSQEEREGFYTVQTGDFVVFFEAEDEVTTPQEFSALQQKYKNSGMKVVSASANINGMAVDNVTMANA